MKIIFFNAKSYDKIYFDKYFAKNKYSVTYIEERLCEATVRLAEGYDAVCIFVNDNAGAGIIDTLVGYGVKMILLRCAGYNNVDVKAAYKRIRVLRVPGYSPSSVAEHALALLMSVGRKTHRAYTRTRDYNFDISGFVSHNLYGKTAGIIGTGKIGAVMADILSGIGMTVLAYDKYPNKELKSVKYITVDELFKKSDIISLHCPLTPETTHLINSKNIDKLKDGVIIINTSRGAIIDTKAVIKGLDSKKIAGLGLDVYEEEEEYFYEDRSEEILDDKELVRLLSYPNVLLTSHQAFLTHEALETIASDTVDNIRACLSGKFMPNEVCYQCESKGKCDKREKGVNCF